MNFHKLKDGGDKIVYLPVGHLIDSDLKMTKGMYTVSNSAPPMQPYSPGFDPIKEGDNLIRFTSGVMKSMLSTIGVFFSDEVRQKYKTLKMTHKMGIVLHGPPGTGKTALARLLMLQEVEKHNAICLDFTGQRMEEMIHTVGIIRKQQDTPIIIFWDELEQIANSYYLLTFLDGVYSFDNLIFIGCTNFPGQIPKRIIDRKSRIKHTFEIKSLESIVYREYITQKLPDLKQEVLDKYVYLAAEADLTIDQLKNSLIDYYIDGVKIEKAIKDAQKIIDTPDTGEFEEEEVD